MDIPKLVDSCLAYITIVFKQSTEKELEDKFGIDLKITEKEEEDLKEEYSYILKMDKNRYAEHRAA